MWWRCGGGVWSAATSAVQALFEFCILQPFRVESKATRTTEPAVVYTLPEAILVSSRAWMEALVRLSLLEAAAALRAAARHIHLYVSRPFLGWLACLRARKQREALLPAALREWRLRGRKRRLRDVVLAWRFLARAGRSRRFGCGPSPNASAMH